MMKFFYFLLLVSLLQSCVVYYNTNDMRNSMNNNIAQIEQNYSLTKNDYLEKMKLYQGLESNVLDKNENSFIHGNQFLCREIVPFAPATVWPFAPPLRWCLSTDCALAASLFI